MTKNYNPSLRTELRYQPIPIIAVKKTESLLEWLKNIGRLQLREVEMLEECEVLKNIENSQEMDDFDLEEE